MYVHYGWFHTSMISVCKINTHEVQYQRKVTATLLQDCNIDELQAELPISQPRYLVISYVRNHSDGRVSYPLCFVFSSPVGEYFTNLPTTIFMHLLRRATSETRGQYYPNIE